MSDVMEVKEASALEGKSIAELAAIFNEKAKALGINETKSTFSNAAAGIKAIEGLEITAAAVKAEGKGKRGKKVKVSPVVEKKAAKKPVVAAKKPAKATSAKVGKFGENPASFKGKLLALLDKNVGKKVAYAAAMKAVYNGDEAKTSALGGVIKGAQVAIENGGHGKLAVDGKGKTLTYTSKK